MAMMASGNGNDAGPGSSGGTGSPYVIEQDEDSMLDGDLLDDDESMFPAF